MAPRPTHGIRPQVRGDPAAAGRKPASALSALAAEDSHLLHSIPAERAALIERIARASPGGGRRNELRQRFLRAYFHGVAEEDLAERPPGQLSRAALAHLEFGARRAAGRSLVRVFNPQMEADGFSSTPSAWPSAGPSWRYT